MLKKISILPGEDSRYATAAAQKFFGNKIKIIPYYPGTDLAIISIENSADGLILPNYALIHSIDLRITGEVWVKTGNNYTRFVILQPENPGDTNEMNKASAYFEVNHYKGSLANVLSIIAKAGINLCKIQSLRNPDRLWTYGFFADMEFDFVQDFNVAIDRIRTSAQTIHVYGVYKSALQPDF